jgi:hypothetical protein
MHFIRVSRRSSKLTHVMLPPLAAFISLYLAGPARAELPRLIPREALVPKPSVMQSMRLSPDGRLISYLGADSAGVQQLWVRDVDRGTVRKLTNVPSPGVTSYEWAQSSHIVCYERRDDSGQKLVAFELATGRERTVVAIDGAEFGNIMTRPVVPGELLLTVKTAGATEEDVYRLDLATGALALDTKNPGRVPGNWFYADAALKVRAVARVRDTGGTEVLVRDEPSGSWRAWLGVDETYELAVEAFSEDGQALLLRTDLGAETTGLVWRRIRDGEQRVIARSGDLDVYSVLRHLTTGAGSELSRRSTPMGGARRVTRRGLPAPRTTGAREPDRLREPRRGRRALARVAVERHSHAPVLSLEPEDA